MNKELKDEVKRIRHLEGVIDAKKGIPPQSKTSYYLGGYGSQMDIDHSLDHSTQLPA